MKIKRALGAVLAIALLPAFSALRNGPEVRAGTEWDIYLSAYTYDAEKTFYLDSASAQGDVTLEGGSVSLDKYKAEAGDQITVTVSPDPGYVVSNVCWGNGLADMEDITDTLTFTMWDNPAHVEVEFTPTQKNYYSYVNYIPNGPAYQYGMKNTIFKSEADAAAFTLPACTFTLIDSSYEFSYWYREGDSKEYLPGDPCPIGAEPVTFFAAYRDKNSNPPYTVQFYAGSGTGSMTNVTLDADSAASYALPECGFTPPEGCQFIMWAQSMTGTNYRPGETCSVPKNGTTFEARYSSSDYCNGSYYGAKFQPGEGTGAMPDVEIDNPYDAYRYTLPDCGFTAPEGKVFAYWKCVSYSYNPGEMYALPCDGYVVFEAVWKDAVPACYVVAVGALNVRAYPGLYNDRIGGLTVGKAFQETDEKLEDGELWVCLDYDGQPGWVMRKYLYLTHSVEAAVKPTKCEVSVGTLNVRSSPAVQDNPSNRITSFTKGREFVATGALKDSNGKNWICLEMDNNGKKQLAYVMGDYVTGDIDMKNISAHSLKINFSIPAGTLIEGKSAVAMPDEVDLKEENLISNDDGLLKAVIFPADAYNFASLTKADILLPDGIGMQVMDMVLQDDGSIALTLCPENPVTVSFLGGSSEVLSTKYISSGKLIAQPDDPKMDGATFEGWYEDKDCTIKFDFTKPVTGDITLYSKFTKEGLPDAGTDTGSETANEGTSTTENKEIVYTAVSDAESWVPGSGKGIVITVKRSEDDADLCFLNFRSVSVDGKPLERDKKYSAKKGSTIVTIYPETLEALGEGVHTITIEFADSKTEIKLSVEKAKEAATTQTPARTNVQTRRVPKTGETAPSYRNTALLVLCVIGLSAIALMDRKKEEEK